MGKEYFQVGIREEEELDSPDHQKIVVYSLPEILPDYHPSFMTLPLFLLHLATRVDWEDEQACFETIALELAEFYTDFSHYLSLSKENKTNTQDAENVKVASNETYTINKNGKTF